MKKILVLAFVSVSFLFGCTAEGFSSASSNNQPEWDGKPPSVGPSTGPTTDPSNPGVPGGGTKYCLFEMFGTVISCEEIDEDDEYSCLMGRIVESCP